MKRLMLLVPGLAAALVFVPSAAAADSAAHTYMLEMDAPNFGTAANGDMVTITGSADFSVNPKSAEGSGTFTHTASNGAVRGSGTWTATGLLDYQSYGCGVVLGTPIPPNLCGGKVKLRVTLTTPAGQLPAPAGQRLGGQAERGRDACCSGRDQLQPHRGRRQRDHSDGLAASVRRGFVRCNEPVDGQPGPGTNRRLIHADVPP